MQPNGNRIPSRKAGLCRKPHYHSKARRRYFAGHCNRLPTMAIIPTTHQQSRRSKKHSKVSRLGRIARLYEIGQVLLVRMPFNPSKAIRICLIMLANAAIFIAKFHIYFSQLYFYFLPRCFTSSSIRSFQFAAIGWLARIQHMASLTTA